MERLGYAALILVGVAVLLFGIPALGLFNIKFWGTKYQNAQTEVFENTNAYTRGTQRDFQNLVLEYHRATTQEEKDAIVSTLRHRAYGTPLNQVPTEVQQLIK